ncbi:MAG: DUF4062 domain-containing protein [Kiritimatiellae bacterium]|jgi:hypothetical protein|nr:DUF4062 domain-containing protein [Kiritimatiellia bacterium]
MKNKPALKIFVSSAVYGYEDLLESIYALLSEYKYEVLMSHKGTVPINPELSAMTSCLKAVDECDLFLGIILPRYGSGKEDSKGLSITHKETLRAIEGNKPRWFLVHENVAIARQLLSPYRNKRCKSAFQLKKGIDFEPTPVLEDLRILDLYEKAMSLDVAEVKHRKANWVQSYGVNDDARLFATAQFRRHRELADKFLPKLRDQNAIADHIKGGRR